MAGDTKFCLVLDSNVLISLLVFADPRYPQIQAAWGAGAVRVVSDRACADEFKRVLAYPQLALDAARQARLYAAFESRVHMHDAGAARRAGAAALPLCRDPDDQKFLELAEACAADFLVTGDREMLRLRRGGRGRLAFSIVTADELESRLAEFDADLDADQDQDQDPDPD